MSILKFKIDSDVIEFRDNKYYITDSEVEIFQFLLDLSSNDMQTLSEEYEIDESILDQVLQDLSEAFR